MGADPPGVRTDAQLVAVERRRGHGLRWRGGSCGRQVVLIDRYANRYLGICGPSLALVLS